MKIQTRIDYRDWKDETDSDEINELIDQAIEENEGTYQKNWMSEPEPMTTREQVISILAKKAVLTFAEGWEMRDADAITQPTKEQLAQQNARIAKVFAEAEKLENSEF